ncbi:type VII toxin-antitoxin system MntA family adenylyltransferase antitoxin [Rubrivirga sp.]|uniref:type VII toxin-antitoxin system MntA family adenylyltransferase antitoxin n=1 Tax=Rubrivirga sp. TaxID=1885344 RepID=UPI003C74C160
MDIDLSPLLDALPDLEAVYVFGSRATGDARPDSDLDIAVLAPAPLDPVERFYVQERLAGHLGLDVDLVDLRSASTVMRAEVLRTGAVVLDRDPTTRAFWEVTAMSAYALLNEERRGILEDVKRRGRVYG